MACFEIFLQFIVKGIYGTSFIIFGRKTVIGKKSVNIKQNEALIEVVKEIFTWYLLHNLLKYNENI